MDGWVGMTVPDGLNGGGWGRIAAVLAEKEAPKGGEVGMCVTAEKNVCPEMPVAPIFGWM